MTTTAKFLVFDTETTGVDTFNDRVVQVYVATADAQGNLLDTWEWLIDPGVEVPEGAAEVHGFTTGFLKENGKQPEEALKEIRDVFLQHRDLPLVAFNLNFDLTLLDSEFKRHGISESFGEWLAKNAKFADGIVIDRHNDKYRKGKRTLEAQARHYGVDFDPEEAHDAGYDVQATAKVTVKILEKFGTPTTAEQSIWYREWATGLEQYLRRSDPSATVNKGWPLREPEGD